MPDGESQFNMGSQEKLTEIYYSQILQEALSRSGGTTRGSRGRGQESHGTWGKCFLLGSMGGMLWGSRSRARLAHSGQKSRVLVSPPGLLSMGDITGTGRQADC